MTIDSRILAIALALLVSTSVAAQKPAGEGATTKNQQAERAKERCRLNHGVDCDTPEGLKEWLLLERTREEAVRDGSRHPLPDSPPLAPKWKLAKFPD